MDIEEISELADDIEYDKNIMWFDYQALFDKTKAVILGKKYNLEIKHTLFEIDTLARMTFFGYDFNQYLLESVLNGNLNSQIKLIKNAILASHKLFVKGCCEFFDGEECKKVPINYRYLVSIVASLSDIDNDIIRQYIIINKNIVPEFINNKEVLPSSFHEVMKNVDLEFN